MKKIIKYLDRYKKPILYNKIGLVLELCKTSLQLSDDDLKDIKKRLTKKIYYMKEKGLTLIKPKYKYYSKWNIMIPLNIYEMTQLQVATDLKKT